MRKSPPCHHLLNTLLCLIPLLPLAPFPEQLLNHQESKPKMSGWERLLIILFLAIGLAGFGLLAFSAG